MANMQSKRLSFYTIIILLFFNFPFITNQTYADNTTFSLNDFSSVTNEINFEGDANIEKTYIQLTHTNDNIKSAISVGRATYFKPLHLWDKSSGNLADFTTQFSFVINSNGNETRGSGMAFFLAPDDTQLPQSSGGPYLGLSTDQNSDTQRPIFVAVEFDTKWSSNLVDPADKKEHIGIDINTVASTEVVPWSYNDISNGGRIEARIDYNSSSKNLTVSVTNGYRNSYNRNYSYNLFYVVDLRDFLTEWVTCGFSAATSLDFFEEHEIHSWEFSSSLQLDDQNVTNSTGSQQVISTAQGKSIGWLWATVGAGAMLVLFFMEKLM